MKGYVGIDPGKNGAMAVLFSNGLIWFVDNPTENMAELLDCGADLFVMIEKAQAMPKQGVVSTFRYGVAYGICLGYLRAYKIPHQEVPPVVWKKEFSIGKDKQKSLAVARELFPHYADFLKSPKDHHRAEALLLAEYGRRKNVGVGAEGECIGSEHLKLYWR